MRKTLQGVFHNSLFVHSFAFCLMVGAAIALYLAAQGNGERWLIPLLALFALANLLELWTP